MIVYYGKNKIPVMGNFYKSQQGVCDGVSQVALVVKNWPARAGDARDAGLIPGSIFPKMPWCRKG